MGLRITAASAAAGDQAPPPATLPGLGELIWILGPVSPGSQIAASRPQWRFASAPGEVCRIEFTVGNHQAAATYLTIASTPLIGPAGIDWRPELDAGPARLLILPGRFVHAEMAMRVPNDLEPGTYRGALTALEVGGDLPVIEITVGESPQ